MIENTLNSLADALRVHAASMAELADALRNSKAAANEPTFAPVADPAPVPAPVPVSVPVSAPVDPVPEEKTEPVAEQAKPEVKQPTLDDARKLVSRILKWHSANNAGNPCPLDVIFESVGAKRVQALTPEQCASFCEQAEAFCEKVEA